MISPFVAAAAKFRSNNGGSNNTSSIGNEEKLNDISGIASGGNASSEAAAAAAATTVESPLPKHPNNDDDDDNSNKDTHNDQEPLRDRTRRRRPRISVLPKAVVDQIAAGEVVQRPVSVVKELLENSLDAGATRIVVQFDGLSKLSIIDDGRGIPKNDLELLCTRHATSKLRSVDDFSDLGTFGFRGEALASTSMVSRLLTVVTRTGNIAGKEAEYDDDDDNASAAVAYSQSYKNGKPIQANPRPCARKVGTTITIEDLFYNVPHRQRAYAKRESDEYGKIHKIVQDYAVHYPTVGFVCQRRMATSGGRASKTKQLVVDCNTGQIPAVRALLQSREKASKSSTSSNNSGNDHKQKIAEATKQILSHVLESNLAGHLLYLECGTDTNPTTTTTPNGSDSKRKPTNDDDELHHNKLPTAARYKFRYAAELYFTSPTYHTGSTRAGKATKPSKPPPGKFILFLNHRLVDLPPLKRALEDVYADLGNPNRNKGNAATAATSSAGKPVLVVNLTVPGCQVDVNVHPSKRQVALMHQEELVQDLARTLRERLEEDGQAFVMESVTPKPSKPIHNPYAKTQPLASNNKRKRSSGQSDRSDVDSDDTGNNDEKKTGNTRCNKKRSNCDGDDDDNDDSASANKKQCRSSAQTPDTDKTGVTAKITPSTNSTTKKVAASKLIRTNAAARAGAIEPFLVSTQRQSQLSQSPSESTPTKNNNSARVSLLSDLRLLHVSMCPLSKPLDKSQQPGGFGDQLRRVICTCPAEPARRTVLIPKTVARPKKVIPTPSKYTSIASLRKRVMKQQCHETTSKMRTAFFMGVLSHQRSLIQCDEDLVMINHFELAKELFYQLALARFGGGAKLAHLGGSSIGGGNGGIHIQTLISQALQCEDEMVLEYERYRERSNNGGSNAKGQDDNGDETTSKLSQRGMLEVNESNRHLAQHVTARLVESSDMLDEYFSIRIEREESLNDKEEDSKKGADDTIDALSSNAILTGLPVLLDGHCPEPHALPLFLLRLATQVDWEREKHCFHGVCKELGNFYAMLPNQGQGELQSYVQHQLFPALSYLMLPSKNPAKNGHFTTMTKLSSLYKVFERC